MILEYICKHCSSIAEHEFENDPTFLLPPKQKECGGCGKMADKILPVSERDRNDALHPLKEKANRHLKPTE